MAPSVWDLGPIGRPAWRHFPESRDIIKGLLVEQLDMAIDDDREPEQPDHYEFMTFAVAPFTYDRLGVEELSTDVIRRFCLFCRDVLDYSGPDTADVSYLFNVYVLDATDEPWVVEMLMQVDPGLVEMVRARYPGSWATS